MQPQQPSVLASMFPLILIFIVFYFLLIRPQKKKQAKHNEMLKGMVKGEAIVTSGGIHGIIQHVKEDTIIVKVNEDTTLEIQKASVSYKK